MFIPPIVLRDSQTPALSLFFLLFNSFMGKKLSYE